MGLSHTPLLCTCTCIKGRSSCTVISVPCRRLMFEDTDEGITWKYYNAKVSSFSLKPKRNFCHLHWLETAGTGSRIYIFCQWIKNGFLSICRRSNYWNNIKENLALPFSSRMQYLLYNNWWQNMLYLHNSSLSFYIAVYSLLDDLLQCLS